MNAIFPGPCLRCGARNYRLSVAGPGICSRCDMARQEEAGAEKLRRWEGWRSGQALPKKEYEP